MTALSLVFPLQNLVNAVVIGFAIGINATIAYFLGAQKQNTADKAASLGTLFNMIHGLILAVVCIAAAAPFLAMFTDKRSIIDMGAAYAQIVFLFAVPMRQVFVLKNFSVSGAHENVHALYADRLCDQYYLRSFYDIWNWFLS